MSDLWKLNLRRRAIWATMNHGSHAGETVEFHIGQVLLITIGGKFYDQARIEWIAETGDGRVLHMVSHVDDEKQRYKIGEMRDEVWEVFYIDSLEEARANYRTTVSPLTLEVVR